MHCLVCFAFVLAVTSSSLGAPQDPFDSEWKAWLAKHGKSYLTPVEGRVRREAWQSRMDLVLSHNERDDNDFTLEMNQFADGTRKSRVLKTSQPVPDDTVDNDTEQLPPKSFDWRKKGAISPVQAQGMMSSADAVGADECVESLIEIKTGKLLELSAPEVQDCCRLHAGNIFDCIHGIGGLCSESSYPGITGDCRNTTCTPAAQIQGGKSVPAGDVDKMVDALLQVPLLVYIDAAEPTFELYRGGIYSETDCNPQQPDHAMQLVGYGEEGGKPFWICKNSWGKNWGEEGYIRVLKGSNICGIESYVAYPF